MKLYEVPAGAHIKLPDGEDIYKFWNIDGMYSYCTDKQEKVIHLAAWTEVEIVNE